MKDIRREIERRSTGAAGRSGTGAVVHAGATQVGA
jgi:hypothetical protein